MLGPLLSGIQSAEPQGTGSDAAASFAAAAAILASVGRPAANSDAANPGTGSRHLDERLAEAALCAIGITLTASESGGSVTVNCCAWHSCVAGLAHEDQLSSCYSGVAHPLALLRPLDVS